MKTRIHDQPTDYFSHEPVAVQKAHFGELLQRAIRAVVQDLEKVINQLWWHLNLMMIQDWWLINDLQNSQNEVVCRYFFEHEKMDIWAKSMEISIRNGVAMVGKSSGVLCAAYLVVCIPTCFRFPLLWSSSWPIHTHFDPSIRLKRDGNTLGFPAYTKKYRSLKVTGSHVNHSIAIQVVYHTEQSFSTAHHTSCSKDIFQKEKTFYIMLREIIMVLSHCRICCFGCVWLNEKISCIIMHTINTVGLTVFAFHFPVRCSQSWRLSPSDRRCRCGLWGGFQIMKDGNFRSGSSRTG